ncbi:MAG: lipoyltransferase [Paramuribaculum sp.]|jgi:lipoyltransferase/lipoate-protein ligase
MRYVTLPDSTPRLLPFYLTMEEYVARRLPDGTDAFFMWQVDPTVIFGRNQVMDNEVNTGYCASRGINVYRRRSGGGCVYADRDNIMFSYITSDADAVTTTFSRYTSMVAGMLRSLGLDASDTSRNDIMIGGRKVSGNAFYHIPGRSIVHGTMLFDTDMANMMAAITPSSVKLDAKGVDSVRSRITVLSEHLPAMDIEQFKDYARRYLCSGPDIALTPDDVRAIEEESRPYYTREWIDGRRAGRAGKPVRIDGAGEFRVAVACDGSGLIERVDLTGDFFMTGDLDSMLLDRLRGVRPEPDAIRQALAGADPSQTIPGLSAEALIKLICHP